MTISVAVIDELARALGEDVPPELRDALIRIEGGERLAGGSVTSVTVTPDVTRARAPSKGALRTRRYRERLKARAAGIAAPEGGVTVTSPEASQSVTQASHVMSPVTVGDASSQKNFPPHPPIRKTKNTKRGASQRHRVTPRQQPIIDQVELDPSDPIYLEITAMRGGREPFVGKRGVSWVTAGEVAVAKARMAETVRPMRPSAVAMHAAIGPPAASRSG